MRSAAPIRMAVLVLLFGVGLAAQMPALASGRAASVVPPAGAVVLAAANDRYLPLAEEIAAHDGQRNGYDIVMLAVGGLALLLVAWRLLRRTMHPAPLLPAALAGLTFAALHALYTLARLGQVTITSRPVAAFPLAWAATFLLVTAGAALYLGASSRKGRELGLWLAALPPLIAMTVGLGWPALGLLILAPPVGPGLYNASLALLALGALIVELVLFEVGFALLRRRALRGRGSQPRPAAADSH